MFTYSRRSIYTDITIHYNIIFYNMLQSGISSLLGCRALWAATTGGNSMNPTCMRSLECCVCAIVLQSPRVREDKKNYTHIMYIHIKCAYRSLVLAYIDLCVVRTTSVFVYGFTWLVCVCVYTCARVEFCGKCDVIRWSNKI